MDMIAEDGIVTGGGIDLLTAQQDRFVNETYSSVDEVTRCELNRLYSEEGVVPSCKPGCFECCGQHIQVNIVEAKALTRYINQEFSQGKIEDLRIRTQKWLKWDKTRRFQSQSPSRSRQPVLDPHLYCPMLVEGECSVYPMRPVICRGHFVRSAPPACRPFYESDSTGDYPVILKSVLKAANQFSSRFKDLIEGAGLNFSGSILLLPHWLAIEMNWE